MEDAILVTGGAGFIGSCFVRRWLERNSGRVVNLDKLTYAASPEALRSVSDDPRYTFVHGDICDKGLVSDLFREHKPCAVVHFAAESHVDRSIDSPDEFLTTNVDGTLNLLKASLEFFRALPADEGERFRFLYVSTDEVYGSAAENTAFTETSRIEPNSPYAASKAAAGHFVRAFQNTHGLPVLQTMCSNNYGPFQFPEKLIPLMVLNAIEGKPMPVYGDGQQFRDWIHVEDHCDALIVVLERGTAGQTYNVGGDGSRPNLDVVRQICDIVDQNRPDLLHRPCSSLIEFVADRPGHDRRYAIDSSKIRSQLEWRPRHSFESGLERTVEWYLNNADWISTVNNRYQRERLGLSSS